MFGASWGRRAAPACARPTPGVVLHQPSRAPAQLQAGVPLLLRVQDEHADLEAPARGRHVQRRAAGAQAGRAEAGRAEAHREQRRVQLGPLADQLSHCGSVAACRAAGVGAAAMEERRGLTNSRKPGHGAAHGSACRTRDGKSLRSTAACPLALPLTRCVAAAQHGQVQRAQPGVRARVDVALQIHHVWHRCLGGGAAAAVCACVRGGRRGGALGRGRGRSWRAQKASWAPTCKACKACRQAASWLASSCCCFGSL